MKTAALILLVVMGCAMVLVDEAHAACTPSGGGECDDYVVECLPSGESRKSSKTPAENCASEGLGES